MHPPRASSLHRAPRGMLMGVVLLATLAAAQPRPQEIDARVHGPLAPHARPSPGALQDPYGWGPSDIHGVDVLFTDDQPLSPGRAMPAGGPLQRFTSRPGAWYSIVFLPMSSQWPVQVWLWQRERTHEIRIFALDAAPWDAPTVSYPVPVRQARFGRRSALMTAPLVLPALSQADGVFLLIEQWRSAGNRPGPLFLQARSHVAFDIDGTPWWSARSDEGSSALTPAIPPSPLNAPRDTSVVVELPILQRPSPLQPDDPMGRR